MVTLKPGQIYGLLGANGAGKTVLLRRLAAEQPGAVLVEVDAGLSATERLAALRRAVEDGAGLLLLDEPFLGLDERVAREGRKLLAAAAAIRPVVLATCSPLLVRELCQRVGFIREGVLAAEGETTALLTPVGYVIEVRGRLDDDWADSFDGFQVTPGPGRTQLRREPCDQAALHGALRRIRDLGLRLVSVTPTFQDPIYVKE